MQDPVQMPQGTSVPKTRREFLFQTGAFAAAATTAAGLLNAPAVHAAENNTIQIALVGAGGRGTGAAANALSVKNGPVKLVAMGDVFEDRLKSSYEGLMGDHKDRMDVPPERRFIGFDAYQKCMDCLKPGDVVILTTPLAFRWVHFKYAIEKGIKKDKKVQIIGFGTFEVKKRAARLGRNPKTGESMKIAASKTVGFKASSTLKGGL